MIYKETYRGCAIYWHPGVKGLPATRGYGSEHGATCDTISAARARIDAEIAASAPTMTPADLYWQGLDHDARRRMRTAYAQDGDRYDTVADYAYALHVSAGQFS